MPSDFADRARSLFNSVSVPSVPYPSTLIKRAGFGGGGKGGSPRLGAGKPLDGSTGAGRSGGQPPNGGDGRDGGDGGDDAAATRGGSGVAATTATGRGAHAGDGDGGIGEIRPVDVDEVRGGGDVAPSSPPDPAANAKTKTKTTRTTTSGADAVNGDDDDVASTLAAVRTSLDAREMAAMGQSLDALEEIPTLSLEDFLRPAFMDNGGGSSATGSEAGTSAPPSQPDTPRQTTAGAGAASSSSHYDADTDLEVPEEVDPRVGDALEELNNSMTDVNTLETELVAARRRWQGSGGMGRHIEDARTEPSKLYFYFT